MYKFMISFVICLLMAGLASADIHIDLGIKGGLTGNYSQPALQLPGNDLSDLNSLGGQFHLSNMPVVDVIIGVDYSWRERSIALAGESFDLEMRDMAVTALVVYPIKLSFGKLYGGAGIGSHSISYSYTRPVSLVLADYNAYIPDGGANLGYTGVIGVQIDMLHIPFGLFIEGRFNRINVPGDDIEYSTAGGGVYIPLP